MCSGHFKNSSSLWNTLYKALRCNNEESTIFHQVFFCHTQKYLQGNEDVFTAYEAVASDQNSARIVSPRRFKSGQEPSQGTVRQQMRY